MAMVLRSRRGQAGMTLVELLMTIAILGIISFALTQSIILGFRTTEGTGSRVSNSAASQSLASSLAADAQSADLVFSGDANTCATDGAFLHLRWTDRAVVLATTTSTSSTTSTSTTAPLPTTTTTPARTELHEVERRVSYSLDPPTGPEQDLLRWTCTNLSPGAESKIIGHISHDGASTPVEVFCDDADILTDPDLDADDPCPAFDPAYSDPVTAVVRLSTEPGTDSDDLVIRRRNP